MCILIMLYQVFIKEIVDKMFVVRNKNILLLLFYPYIVVLYASILNSTITMHYYISVASAMEISLLAQNIPNSVAYLTQFSNGWHKFLHV